MTIDELKKMLAEKVARYNALTKEALMIRGEIRLLQNLIGKMPVEKPPEKEQVI